MLGQPASSQTVCRPPLRTSPLSSEYCGPVWARVRIHSGLRSIGVSLLRTSRRSSLRPSGAIVTSARLRGEIGFAAVVVSRRQSPPARGAPDLHRAPAGGDLRRAAACRANGGGGGLRRVLP